MGECKHHAKALASDGREQHELDMHARCRTWRISSRDIRVKKYKDQAGADCGKGHIARHMSCVFIFDVDRKMPFSASLYDLHDLQWFNAHERTHLACLIDITASIVATTSNNKGSCAN